MRHLDEGMIHAWLDGALAGDEAAGVARHVAECRDCAALAAEARGMIAAAGNIVSALDGVRGGVIPAPSGAAGGQHSLWRRLRLTPARAALAATLLIAVASLLTVRSASRPVASDSRVDRVSAFPGLSASPAPAATALQTESPKSATVTAKSAASTRPSVASIATQTADTGSRTAKRGVTGVSPSADRVVAGARQPVLDSTANRGPDQTFAKPAAAPVPPTNIASAAAVAAQASGAVADARAAAAERRAPSALKLESVAVTGASSAKAFAQSSEFEGCFQVRPDSVSSAIPVGFPQRFALVNASGVAPYAVRSVSPEGRVDSIVPGGGWQRVTPQLVRVWFANAPAQPSLTLQFAADGITARASVGNQTANVPVTRIECRR